MRRPWRHRFKRLVRRLPAFRAALPVAVGDAIDGAWIALRPPNDDGPRVIVQFEGRNGWLFKADTAPEVLIRIFPDLSEHQLAQAATRLRARVTAKLRSLAATNSDPEQRRWRDRY